MNLQSLPDDILIIIIEKLDIKSLYNLHNACERIRNIICTYGIIKTCNLTLNVIANIETLKSSFFKDISRCLQELNISGMQNLNKSNFFPAVRRLKCLKKLDVTYTNITMYDLIEICNACPALKDISIHFSFGVPKKDLNLSRLIQTCQGAFKNFSHVHFIGRDYNLFSTKLPSLMLKDAKLKKLQYSAVPDSSSEMYFNYVYDDHNLDVDSFFMYFMNNNYSNLLRIPKPNLVSTGNTIKISDFLLDLEKYETFIIVITKCVLSVTVKYYASPIIKKFFMEYPDISPLLMDVQNRYHIIMDLNSNGYIMQWKKTTTNFNNKFFTDLYYKLKSFIPYYFETYKTPVPVHYDLYITSPSPQQIQDADEFDSGIKRKRTAPPSSVLNYDITFREKSKIQLIFNFTDLIKVVTLSPKCDYLNKLTYLCLSGSVKYSLQFFNLLFRCCNNLITLIVSAPLVHPCCGAIALSIPSSQSIKNVLLYDKLNYQSLFTSMGQCKTLENVQLFDMSLEIGNVSDPTIMFDKCENLYCLYIYTPFNYSSKKRNLRMLQKANKRCQKQVAIQILPNQHLIYDPNTAVFNINLIKCH